MLSPGDLFFHAYGEDARFAAQHFEFLKDYAPKNSPRLEPQDLEEVDFPLDMARISHGETMEFPGEPHDLLREKRRRSRITWDEHGRRARRQNLGRDWREKMEVKHQKLIYHIVL